LGASVAALPTFWLPSASGLDAGGCRPPSAFALDGLAGALAEAIVFMMLWTPPRQSAA